jgi:hypothetical protein
MVAHRARVLTVAVVAAAMLVAIGSWEVYQGAEALAQGPEVQFKCYTLAQTEGAVGESVNLTTEQFPPPRAECAGRGPAGPLCAGHEATWHAGN